METNINTSPIASGSQLPPQSTDQSTSSEHARIGPAAAVIIVLVLLIAAGLYFWGAKLSQEMPPEALPYIPGDESMQPGGLDSGAHDASMNEPTAGIPVQSSSDDAASIQADFNQLNLDALEAQTSAELNNL